MFQHLFPLCTKINKKELLTNFVENQQESMQHLGARYYPDGSLISGNKQNPKSQTQPQPLSYWIFTNTHLIPRMSRRSLFQTDPVLSALGNNSRPRITLEQFELPSFHCQHSFHLFISPLLRRRVFIRVVNAWEKGNSILGYHYQKECSIRCNSVNISHLRERNNLFLQRNFWKEELLIGGSTSFP